MKHQDQQINFFVGTHKKSFYIVECYNDHYNLRENDLDEEEDEEDEHDEEDDL